MLEANEDESQLLGNLRLGREMFGEGLGGWVDDVRQGGEYALDDEVGHHAQGGKVQVLQLGHQGQVGCQVRADVFAQLGDGLAHRQGTAVLLAGQERRPLSWVVGDQGVYRADMPSQKEQRREQRIAVTNLRSPDEV